MRFNGDGRVLPPEPGTTRFKTRFAWRPTLVGGILIWLERYQAMEAYIVMNYQVNIGEEVVGVKHGEWKQISVRLIKKK